ncbi:hypothetical protein C8R46DRAFT_1234103 [Mycena filopes]|nr:hypothetical protein C8R46DRAFT_1234103 [Mycena filopes]
MHLLDLQNDTLLRILSLCDIRTVVNELLHQIALVKPLWVSLVRDLSERGILAPLPAELLASYTTDDLIDEVKRVVFGPRTWNDDEMVTAIPQRENIVRLKHPPSMEATIELVFGGRYVVVRDGLALDLWECSSGRRIWTSPRQPITTWAINLTERGTAAHILLFGAPPECVAQIIWIELATGRARLVCQLAFGGSGEGHFERATILGDVFAASYTDVGQLLDLTLLVNWREETFVFLQCIRTLQTTPALLPGHIALTYATWGGCNQQTLVVYSFLSLVWLPIKCFGTDLTLAFRTPVPDLPAVLLLDRLPVGTYASQAAPRATFSVLESPLERGEYKFMLYTSHRPATRKMRHRSVLPGADDVPEGILSHLFCYSFSLASGESPAQWRRLSTLPARPYLDEPAISYSGHCIVRRPLSIAVADVCSAHETVEWQCTWEAEPGQRSCAALDLAPYGGVVAALGYKSITVTHFL